MQISRFTHTVTLFRSASPALVAIAALCLVCTLQTQFAYAQVATTSAAKVAPSFSKHGLLCTTDGTPVYGFANLKPTTWLGLQVFHANFVQFNGKAPATMGNVAIAPSAQAGTFIWVSDLGPSGVITGTASGVFWEDAQHRKGTYKPL